jgi:hypothetical protein
MSRAVGGLLYLLQARQVTRGGGDSIALGICPACGRNVTLSRANSIGARCSYDGAQFNKQGELIWHSGRRPDGSYWRMIRCIVDGCTRLVQDSGAAEQLIRSMASARQHGRWQTYQRKHEQLHRLG